MTHRQDLSVVVMRLADGVLLKVHPSHLKLYSPRDLDFSFLPDSVVKILGKPLTEEGLKNISLSDPLELMYVEPSSRSQEERVLTRKRARAELEKAEQPESEYESEDEVLRDSVSFAP